jgi:deoxyadenosine/deoxycytidine kinase
MAYKRCHCGKKATYIIQGVSELDKYTNALPQIMVKLCSEHRPQLSSAFKGDREKEEKRIIIINRPRTYPAYNKNKEKEETYIADYPKNECRYCGSKNVTYHQKITSVDPNDHFTIPAVPIIPLEYWICNKCLKS